MKVVAIERNYCKCCKSKQMIPWFTNESWSTICENILTPLAKNVLIPLGVTVAA